MAFRVVRWLAGGIVCFVVGKMVFSFGENVMMLAREAREHRQTIAALREERDRLSQKKRSLQVGVDYLIPILLRKVFGRSAANGPRIVEEKIDLAELFQGVVDDGPDIFHLRHVGS